ncbi:hypothetical protein [Haloplasma contractile]|uniref:Uncharacterized protein n=1 Tax=Haloplasma contractile SSD-17B TaxID=1033810 RepID=U2FG26_9MOLU|nr:hypothetical protein [Haloplasma contractile]ERJ11850.1 hypothetical protein HLPCO_002090 [Haloplasma contractile SSD-17B]
MRVLSSILIIATCIFSSFITLTYAIMFHTGYFSGNIAIVLFEILRIGSVVSYTVLLFSNMKRHQNLPFIIALSYTILAVFCVVYFRTPYIFPNSMKQAIIESIVSGLLLLSFIYNQSYTHFKRTLLNALSIKLMLSFITILYRFLSRDVYMILLPILTVSANTLLVLFFIQLIIDLQVTREHPICSTPNTLNQVTKTGLYINVISGIITFFSLIAISIIKLSIINFSTEPVITLFLFFLVLFLMLCLMSIYHSHKVLNGEKDQLTHAILYGILSVSNVGTLLLFIGSNEQLNAKNTQ